MKKLMIAAFAVAFAAVAQAATIVWGSGTVYIAADAEGTVGTGTAYKANATTRAVDMLVYMIADAQEFASVQAMSANDIYKNYVLNTQLTPEKKTTTALGTASITQTVAGGSSEVPAVYNALVVYVDTKTASAYDNVDAFVKTTTTTVSFQDNGQASPAIGAATIGKWEAVPEPTSGLLMLLGLAGLALKRKVA